MTVTVEDYHRMIEIGVLTEDDKVELLEGEIVDVSPEGPSHAAVQSRLARFLIRGLVDDRLIVRVGNPLTIRPLSEPEPDFSIVDEADSTRTSHPERAHLVVEVSYSSLRKDRARKAGIYARAGVPEYWIVDLVHLRVEVRTRPVDGAYTELRILEAPAVLEAATVELPGLDLAALFA